MPAHRGRSGDPHRQARGPRASPSAARPVAPLGEPAQRDLERQPQGRCPRSLAARPRRDAAATPRHAARSARRTRRACADRLRRPSAFRAAADDAGRPRRARTLTLHRGDSAVRDRPTSTFQGTLADASGDLRPPAGRHRGAGACPVRQPAARPGRSAGKGDARGPAQSLPGAAIPIISSRRSRRPHRPPADAGAPAGIGAVAISPAGSARSSSRSSSSPTRPSSNDHRLTVLEQQFAKLKGDTDYRLNAIEGGARCGAARGGRRAGRAAARSRARRSRRRSGRRAASRSVARGRRPPRRWARSAATRAATGRRQQRRCRPRRQDRRSGRGRLHGRLQAVDAEEICRCRAAAQARSSPNIPSSKRASYAQNLIGRSYLDDGKPGLAADAFYTSYKKFPHGDRAPDSLYYLGQSLMRLRSRPTPARSMASSSDVYGANRRRERSRRVTQGRADAKCSADPGWSRALPERSRRAARAALGCCRRRSDRRRGLGRPDSLALLLLARAARRCGVPRRRSITACAPKAADEARCAPTLAPLSACRTPIAAVAVGEAATACRRAARDARYAALAAWAGAQGLPRPHRASADDQAETRADASGARRRAVRGLAACAPCAPASDRGARRCCARCSGGARPSWSRSSRRRASRRRTIPPTHDPRYRSYRRARLLAARRGSMPSESWPPPTICGGRRGARLACRSMLVDAVAHDGRVVLLTRRRRCRTSSRRRTLHTPVFRAISRASRTAPRSIAL